MLPDISGCNQVLETINEYLRAATHDSARLARALAFVRTRQAVAYSPEQAPSTARAALQQAMDELAHDQARACAAVDEPTELERSHVRDWQHGQIRDLTRQIRELEQRLEQQPKRRKRV